MASEEFAVHGTEGAANCRVFSSLEQAENFARQQVALRPDLRARIYGHEGFIGAPVSQLTGASFKGERDLSPRVRRWLGIGFLAVGSGLVVWDWSTGFRMTWPGVVGSRLLIPGAILVVTEFLIWLTARQRAR